ncbi:DNA-3-methyladenine glycosylase I [Roseibium sp.]|uniref:DNA-3-methyladenine glycosylase I n=1 Tax=Roseibium sp. TaxID=1936156 RepID=UPI003A97B9B8
MSDVGDGLMLGSDGKMRCWWHGGLEDYQRYHDEEWGHPVANDIRLFEKLSLEGFQAGLSWLTILRKRDAFRAAFAGFDFEKVARFTEADVERCLADPGIVRHRGKILAVINNAARALELKDEFGSLARYVWNFEPKPDTRPSTLDYATARKMATSPESIAMSKDLKKRGWKFVGPTTMYAFMQSMGIVNDHLEDCCCRPLIEEARNRFVRP